MDTREEAARAAGGLRVWALASLGRRWFYGWTMLAVGALGLFASGPGQSHTFSVFVRPLARDLDLPSTAVASAYGLATLGAALALPWMGRRVDRLGPRRVALGIALALGGACLAFGAVVNLASLVVGFTLLRFLGQGSLMLVCSNLVAQWFQRRRGVAMSLMALGFAASMAIHPPLGQALVASVGWRGAWVVFGVLTWLLLLPPWVLLVWDRPEDVGLAPDGDRGSSHPGTGPAVLGGLTLREALATPAFYIVAAGWFTIAMLVTALHFYQVSILTNQGVAPDVAARLFPVSALTMVLTMPLVGRAFDRIRTRWVFGVGLLTMAAALVGVTWVRDTFTAVIYALVFGLTNAFSMTMFGYLWPRYFGRRHLGSIQGVGQMVGVAGASLGPLPVGLAFDLVGDPRGALRLLAALPVGCALAAVCLRTPRGVTGSEHLE